MQSDKDPVNVEPLKWIGGLTGYVVPEGTPERQVTFHGMPVQRDDYGYPYVAVTLKPRHVQRLRAGKPARLWHREGKPRALTHWLAKQRRKEGRP